MHRGTFIAILLGGLAVVGLIAAQAGGNDSANSGTSTASESTGTASESTGTASENIGTASENIGTASESTGTASAEAGRLSEAPPILGEAGTLTNIDGWINTDKASFEDFAGQVRIVQFWTYTCHNCTATIPHLQEIYADHRAEGLEIIGVHAPEFEFEKDPANVTQATVDLGVTWPVALDTDKTNFRAWQTDRRFWPRTFVVDQLGQIRFDRIGEGKYTELHDTAVWLLENGP